MFTLKNISLTHFKNYDFSRFEFSGRIIGICGLNGKGKTNLLDAIYYCCFTKSYFAVSDSLNVNFNKDGFRLEANFNSASRDRKIICVHRGAGKKELSLNDVPYEKLSAHIGLLPAVMIAPDDIEIITGASELRRKYIDTLLCQLDTDYLQELMQYNRVLQQRNSLLKRFAEQNKVDDALLDILSEQLIAPGNYVFKKRIELLNELTPIVQGMYAKFAGNAETVRVDYESKLKSLTFRELLQANIEKDRILQRTNAGIHKDELKFELNGQAFKSIASQGQRKSLLFALKLAEFVLLKKYKGFAPLLLLDDVFEKLDAKRMQQLLQWVCNDNDGQVFITDTHRQRLNDALAYLNEAFELIEL